MLVYNSDLNIPTNWDEITVEQFIELNSIDLPQFESEFYLNLEKLSIVTNTSSDDSCWEEMDVIELSNIINSSNFLFNSPPNKYKKELSGDFILKSFNDLTLGEFIDIEYYISEDLIKNFKIILSILYRKYKIGEWGELIIEPYDVIDLEIRSKYFEEIPITSVFGVINNYLDFKNTFITKYNPLFEPNIDENEDLDKYQSIIGDNIIDDDEEDKKIEEKQKKWAWEKLLFGIANGDILKINNITKLGLIYIFNMLSMRKELGITD